MTLSTLIQVIFYIVLISLFIRAVIQSIRELFVFIHIKKTGKLVQAKIEDFKERRSGDGVTYPAVVSYKTNTGEKIIATSKTSSFMKPSIGKEVWVIYSSSDPSQFYFRNSMVPFFMIFIILIVGSVSIFLIAQLFKIIFE